MKDVGKPFGVTSIYGATTRKGLVEITLGTERTQMLPVKAREIASMILEAASAAEGDEILLHVLANANMSRTAIAQVLLAIRQERAVQEREARKEMRRQIAEDQEEFDLDRESS